MDWHEKKNLLIVTEKRQGLDSIDGVLLFI